MMKHRVTEFWYINWKNVRKHYSVIDPYLSFERAQQYVAEGETEKGQEPEWVLHGLVQKPEGHYVRRTFRIARLLETPQ